MKVLSLTLFATLLVIYCTAQKPVLIKNINPTSQSYISNLTLFKDKVFFSAADDRGSALWCTDGTSQGTIKVKDVIAGMNSSNFNLPFTVMGDKMFFVGKLSELWVSDGTTNGTKLIKQFSNGNHSGLGEFTAFENKLFFRVDNGEGDALWVTDGTPEGTVKIKNFIQSNDAYRYPANMMVINDKLFFRFGEGSVANELWTTDGTEASTVRLLKIETSDAPLMDNFTAIGNKIFFRLNSDLWVTNGTPSNTFPLCKILGNWSPQFGNEKNVVVYNNLLFFAGVSNNGDVDLWRSDGTLVGTYALKDSNPTGNFEVWNFIIINDLLYFKANHPDYGINIWVSDGTPQNTRKLGNVPYKIEDFGKELISFQNKIYFVGTGLNTYRLLWVTDGTDAGTTLFKKLTQNDVAEPHSYFAHKNKLFFWAKKDVDNFTIGYVLWVTDGTPENTFVVKDFLGNFNASPGFIEVGEHLFVLAKEYDNSYERSLWYTDGTPETTRLMKPDGAPYSEIAPDARFIKYKNSLIYTAFYEDGIGNELYIINTDNITNIDDPNGLSVHGLSLFPNPSSGNIHLQFSKEENINKIEIFNIYGNNIQTIPFSNSSLVLLCHFRKSI